VGANPALGGALEAKTLAEFGSLKALDAADAGLRGPLPESLPAGLERLRLGDDKSVNSNRFDGPLPDYSRAALVLLAVPGCGLRGPLPPLPPKLEKLVLGTKANRGDANAFEGSLPAAWADNARLETLVACNCGVTDVPKAWARLRLAAVDLRENKFADAKAARRILKKGCSGLVKL